MKRLILLFPLSCLLLNPVYPGTQEPDPALLEFADSVEITINRKDPGFLNRAMDYDAFLDGILIEGGIQADSLHRFNKGFKKEFVESFNLGGEIIQNIAGNGFYTFLKAYANDQEDHLIFRLYSDNGINYHDYRMVKREGHYRIRDVYIYLSGENMSETIRRIYTSYASTLLIGTENTEGTLDYLYGIIGLRTIQQYLAQNLYMEALHVMDSIPERIRKEKAFQIIGLRIKANLDEGHFAQAIDDYIHSFPGDPSLNLVAIDGYYLTGKYHNALENVDSLDRKVGSDPVLDLYRGNLLNMAGDTLLAQQAYVRLINNIPTLELGYANLIDLYLAGKRYTDAIGVLDLYMTKFDVGKQDILTWAANYPAFSESAEFCKWLEKY
jgi:tetratricopeptide (TPR) repeat protein